MYSSRYGRPNMANLTGEFGRAVFNHINNTPKPNDEAMAEEARKLEQKMVKARKLSDAKRNTSNCTVSNRTPS